MSLDKQSVEQRVNRLEERFSDLIDCTYKALLEKKVVGDVGCFRSSLLSVKVSQKHIHQEFIHEHLVKVDQKTTFDDLWIRLSNYCNFLNFDLLEHVISKFGGEDLKHKMECYKCELQSFRKATKLRDFIDCWPVQGERPPETDLREFVAKMKHDWENCTLEDLETLKGVITRKFFVPEFAIKLRKIMEGSIVITWLVPAPLVKALQEAVETTSSDFFLEHKIETITVDRKVCHPSPSRKHVDYPKEQFTSPGVEVQREKIPLRILPEKLHSFKSGTSEEQPLPKETHRMRLAEEILSGQSMSMAPEEVQLSIHPSDIQGEKSTPSFLSKLKQKFGIRSRMPSGTIPRTGYRSSYSSRVPSSFHTPTLKEMEELSLMPKSHTRLGGTGPRSGFLSSSSEDWFETSTPPEKDVRKGDWVNPPTPAERYVREKCVDEISQHVKLLPLVEQHLSEADVEADTSLPTKYKNYLSSTPAIRAALYTTFNAKMAAKVFTWSQHTESPPPTTTTELFTAFTLKTLEDHLSTHPVYHKQQLKVITFSDLPTDVYKQFQGLCRMAYEGILNRQQLVFSAAHLPTGFAPLGLIQEVPQLYTEGRASSYHFIHLTLQEYLAAVHISQLPAHEQARLFQEHVNSGHFKMTMRFLAGHTKLANIPVDITMDTKRTITRRLMKSTELNYSQLLEAEDISVSTEHLHSDERARRSLERENAKLTYFHFLFEAKDISMTTRTLGSDEMRVRSHYSWTPLDYYVTGHTISHSNCPWRLDFNNYFKDNEKFELLCQGCAAPGGTGCRGHISYADFSSNDLTSKSIQSFVNIPPHILQNMRELVLNSNKLDGSACDLLAKAVPSMSRLEVLWLDYNPVGSGGAVEVIKALCGSGVKKLSLTSTGIGEPDCEALCELLNSLNTTLKDLSLAFNTIGEEGVTAIAKMLVENKSMTWLWLFGCHISGHGASELAAALCKNSTLKHLYMQNNPIGVEGASSMSDMLRHNTSLEDLNLRDNSVGEEGVHQLINSLKHNQTLRELGLPKKYKTKTSDHRIYWW